MPSIECGQAIRYPGCPPGSSGCLTRFASRPDQLLLLAAGHTVLTGTAKQLDPIEALDLPDGPIGRLLTWTSLEGDTTVDAALIWVDPARVAPRIRGLGTPAGINPTPALGAALRICAASDTTAPRQGTIVKLAADIAVTILGPGWQQMVTYRNQILCTEFTDPADCGAIAVDQEKRVVGMVAAGGAGPDGRGATVITPIAAVLNHRDWHGLTLELADAATGIGAPPNLDSASLPAAMIDDPATARDVLARTLWAEDRGGKAEGMRAVAAVIVNRVRTGQSRFGATIEAVCQQPWQFSCWNPGENENHQRMLLITEVDPDFKLALDIADEAIAGRLSDPTGGARHYVSLALFNAKCLGSRPADTFYCRTAPDDRQVIADQIYFRNVS